MAVRKVAEQTGPRPSDTEALQVAADETPATEEQGRAEDPVPAQAPDIPVDPQIPQEPITSQPAVSSTEKGTVPEEPIIQQEPSVPQESTQKEPTVQEPITQQEPTVIQQAISSTQKEATPQEPTASAVNPVQDLDLSGLLSFDPATIRSTTSATNVQPVAIMDRLRHVKGLLSAPIETLVRDSEEVRRTLEEIEPELPEALHARVWPTGFFPFYKGKLMSARRRIEARRSQLPLKAEIAQKCQLLNDQKAVLDAKIDTSAITQELELGEGIGRSQSKSSGNRAAHPGEENSYSKLQAGSRGSDYPDASGTCRIGYLALRQQLVSGRDEDDEAIIAEIEDVRVEAISAIEEFIQKHTA